MPSFDIISDIHLDHLTGTGDKGLEFIDSVFENPTAPNLLIGGDVGFQSDFYSSYFFDLVKKKYEKVVCILGNHDYWGFDLNTESPWKYWSERYNAPNIHFLSLSEPNEIIIDDTVVIGGTLWSELDPVYEVLIQAALNDFKAIKKFSLEQYKALYNLELENLKKQIDKFSDQKTLILTHHAPTYQTTERWSQSPIKSCFCTSLEDIILDNPQIKAWVFGHCHESYVIHIGQAKVLEHSFGYYNANNQSFKPLHLEI